MLLEVGQLKKVLDLVDDDFKIEYVDDVTNHLISDRIEIDLSNKKLIFKSE